MTKIAIPIGGSCWFVSIGNEFEIPVTSYLKSRDIFYTTLAFTKPDITIDTIMSALDFVEMLQKTIELLSKMEAGE